MIKELKKLKPMIESIGIGKIEDNILSIRGEVCYYWIPFGRISSEYYNDLNHNCSSICYYDYITEVPLYITVNPIPFNLMSKKIHLHEKVIEYLKNFIVDVYELTINEDKNNYPLYRINTHKVEIEIPTSIHTGEINWVICSAYQPDKIYFFSTDGNKKGEPI